LSKKNKNFISNHLTQQVTKQQTSIIKIKFPTEIKIFNSNPVHIILQRYIIGIEIILNAEKTGFKLRNPIICIIENRNIMDYASLISMK